MSFTTDLLVNLAEHLDAEGVATWRDPAGVDPGYAWNESAIFIVTTQPSPDRAITLTPYGGDDDPRESDSTLSLQVRSRGVGENPDSAQELDDAVFNALHGLPWLTVANVVGCYRTSAAYLGRDENDRHELSSNYRLDLHRPR